MQHNKNSPLLPLFLLLPFSNLLLSHKRGRTAGLLPACSSSFRQRPVRVRPLFIRILLLYPHRVFTWTKIIYPTGVYLSRENSFIFIKCQLLQYDRQANTFTAALRNYKERQACPHHFATRQTAASAFHTPTGTVYPATLYPATDTDMLPVRQCRRL